MVAMHAVFFSTAIVVYSCDVLHKSHFNYVLITLMHFFCCVVFYLHLLFAISSCMILTCCFVVSSVCRAAAGVQGRSDKNHCVAYKRQGRFSYTYVYTLCCAIGVHAACRDGKVLKPAFCQ